MNNKAHTFPDCPVIIGKGSLQKYITIGKSKALKTGVSIFLYTEDNKLVCPELHFTDTETFRHFAEVVKDYADRHMEEEE